MIVIIEGVDGAGKSTLARVFEAHGQSLGLETSIVHSGPPGKDVWHAYSDLVLGTHPDQLAIFDRLHFGELVYGTTRRDRPAFGFQGLMDLNDLILAKRGITIVLNPPYAKVVGQIRQKGEWIRDHPTLPDEAILFKHLALVESGRTPRAVRYVDDTPEEGFEKSILLSLMAGERWK